MAKVSNVPVHHLEGSCNTEQENKVHIAMEQSDNNSTWTKTAAGGQVAEEGADIVQSNLDYASAAAGATSKSQQLQQEQQERDDSCKAPAWYARQDVHMLVAGVLFIVVLLAMTAVVGQARGWDADSGFTHNETESSQDRFLSEPFVEEPGVRGRYGKDATSRWYYWKLKPELTSFVTHAFPWIAYSLHLLFVWAIIYWTQMHKARQPMGRGRYSTELRGYNYIAFGGNALFHLIHFINTHLTYDGLAQDVSISTSQASVVMALCLVFLLEYKERGIFFGWPTRQHSTGRVSRKLLLDYSPINIIRRYHGYAIAWAAVYTFWYHPMENTVGHLMGFIYTWIIMLQGSLMYTDLHIAPWWRLMQEAWVVVHSGVVAAQTGGDDMKGTRLWPRFVFGFSLALVVTQIFTLRFWYRIPTWTRVIPLLLYTAVTLWAYSWIPDENGDPWVRLPEIFTVPSSFYIFFLVGWGLLWLWLRVERRVYGATLAPVQEALGVGKAMLYLVSAAMMFAICTALAIVCEYDDWIAGLVQLMLGFVAIFITASSIAFMLLRRAVPLRLKPSGGSGTTGQLASVTTATAEKQLPEKAAHTNGQKETLEDEVIGKENTVNTKF